MKYIYLAERRLALSYLSMKAGLGRAREVFRVRSFDVSSSEGRAKERHRRIALSAIASVIARGISIGTAVISVPLTLHYLGPERYGMWMVMSSLIVFIGFADLGIGNGLLTLVASVNGKDSVIGVRKYASSGFVALSLIAMTMMGFFIVAYSQVEWSRLFNVQSDLAKNEAGPAFAVFFCSITIAIPLGVVQKVQIGLQQSFVVSLWQSLGSVLGLAGVLAVIYLQGNMPWLVFALATLPALATLMNNLSFFWFARRDLCPSWSFVESATMMHIGQMGGLFLVIQVAGAIIFASDAILISRWLGAAAVADYAVTEKMFSFASILVSMLTSPLWPAYGEAISRGDNVWVRHTLFRSISVSGVLSAVISVALILHGPRILEVWVGHAITAPLPLLLGFGIWKVMEACGAAMAAYLNGAHLIGFQALTASLTAACAILLKIYFLSKLGITGVIWATILAYAFCTALPVCCFLAWQLSVGRTNDKIGG